MDLPKNSMLFNKNFMNEYDTDQISTFGMMIETSDNGNNWKEEEPKLLEYINSNEFEFNEKKKEENIKMQPPDPNYNEEDNGLRKSQLYKELIK